MVDKIKEVKKVFLKDGWQCQVNNPHGVWMLGQILGASGGCCDLTSLPKLQSQVPVSAFDQCLVALCGMSQTFISGFGTKDFVLRTSCWPMTTGL